MKYLIQANSEMENRIEVTRDGERSLVSYRLIVRVTIWDNNTVLEMQSSDGCTTQ